MKFSFDDNVKCIIFDVDGTLLDSMPMWNGITYDYPASKHIYNLPEGLPQIMNSKSLLQCAEYYKNVLGVPGTVESISKEIVDFAREGYRTRVPEKKGALRFVRKAHEKGIKLAIATASGMSGVIPALKRTGIFEYIDYKISCDEINTTKESPLIFLNCAEYFNLSPEDCIVAEDALYSVKTAKSAGFRVLVIKEDVHPDKDTEELKRIADYYADDFTEFLGIEKEKK
jgi:HAD superfamily hydrolase (TIGR01509 family)